MNVSKRVKSCFVNGCLSNSEGFRDKVFVTVPQTETRRRAWFEAARQPYVCSKTIRFCCEDHFNVPEDFENYMRYKLLGGQVLLKKHVVPHKFKRQFSTTLDLSCETELVEQPDIKKLKISTDNLPSTSGSTSLQCTVGIQVGYLTYNVGVQTHLEQKDFSVSVSPQTRDFSVMCNIISKKQKRHVKLGTSDLSLETDVGASTFKHPPQVRKPFQHHDSSISITSEEDIKSSTSEYVPTSGSVSEERNIEWLRELEKNTAYDNMLKLVEKNPKRYIGIPKQWYEIVINKLCAKAKLKKADILLCLMKIKLNDSFMRLGDQFGISFGRASTIFKKTIPQIEFYLKTLIFWPKPEIIKMLLPIPFRSRYSDVQSIIDCLEIEIQKPTNSLKQALTWSEYKKCNTVKFLISCTPDGFINFVSTGYGGRTSDMTILEQCDFLKVLPINCYVMADRGFKHINKLLAQKQCVLVRPPSVSSSAKLSKQEVIESKRIASLRIHVERVIKRLREFGFLKPHAVIDHSLIAYTDSVINICCALINLQTPIVRK